jgi:branched-chain amino acid transport system permease protein
MGHLIASAVVTGIGIGSVYGLIAIGYTVVFNATGVFNLAQGDLVMVGVILSYFMLEHLLWPQAAVVVAVIVAVTLLSVLEERVVVRPFLGRRGGIGWFIATLAFAGILETVAGLLYGNTPVQSVPSPFSRNAIVVGPLTLQPQMLLAVGALVGVVVLAAVFYRYSWLGQAMRATAEDREAASLRGIRPGQMSTLAFALGGMVAGLAGYIVAPIVFADVTIGLNYTLTGFLALAIGGFGSRIGAIAGALLLGVSQQLFDLYVDPRYETLAGLGLLIIVLAVRPTGLFRVAAERRV